MDNRIAKSAAERYEAGRTLDEGCSRAMAACVDMIDGAGAIGVRDELHAVRDALQHLHGAAALAYETACRTMQN